MAIYILYTLTKTSDGESEWSFLATKNSLNDLAKTITDYQGMLLDIMIEELDRQLNEEEFVILGSLLIIKHEDKLRITSQTFLTDMLALRLPGKFSVVGIYSVAWDAPEGSYRGSVKDLSKKEVHVMFVPADNTAFTRKSLSSVTRNLGQLDIFLNQFVKFAVLGSVYYLYSRQEDEPDYELFDILPHHENIVGACMSKILSQPSELMEPAWSIDPIWDTLKTDILHVGMDNSPVYAFTVSQAHTSFRIVYKNITDSLNDG